MTNIFAPAGPLFTAAFNSDFTEATLKLRTDRDYSFPTGVSVTNGTVWIVEGQLDHVFDFGNGAQGTPPVLPFQVVNEVLEDLVPEFFATTPEPTSAARNTMGFWGAGGLALGIGFSLVAN